MSSYWLWSMG